MVSPVEQGTVATFDADSGTGIVVSDEGHEVVFDQEAFAASGLRFLRPGQRVRLDRTEQGRLERVTIVTMR